MTQRTYRPDRRALIREEHLRQHERVSIRDQQRLDEIKAMTNPGQPTTVTHWLASQLDRNAPTTPRSDASG